MNITYTRGLAAPKSLARGTKAGFTLLEVMIVTTIVAILSLLAMVAVGRIKERAARTVITNNLR